MPTPPYSSSPLAADQAPEYSGHPPQSRRPEATSAILPPPRTGWQSFRTGFSTMARYPHVALLSWAANLFTALLLAVLPALTLATGPGDRPVMRDLADGVDSWFLLESLMSSQAEGQLAQNTPGVDLSIGLGGVSLTVLLALLVLPALAWLLGALLQGGILLTYHDTPRPFRWGPFLSACRHWWGSFLLLGAVQGLAALVFLMPLIVGAVAAFVAGNSNLGWLLVAIVWFANLFGLAVFERTRVLAVLGNTRNMLAVFRDALRTLIRAPLPVAILYLLTAAVALLLQLIHRLGLGPLVPLDAWLLIFLIGQIFVSARLVVRLARIAGTAAHARSLYPSLMELEPS